ncbi:MAG TPA: type IX secretion system outer membrane channel protein PorV [Flavobacteriales bacterium]|nr:type IX secretion system outer membrane channel protein PorV [Flavobacteriales bacterium]HHZ94302.1 type IX secretion system outer membrane channel protein PorV [Flavobacteriales bacterium]HIB76156.1 type IX secretion system outer membrane channel protein PorV [Flavobacteriales bacterium]HIN42298.1 type IX secretion system outer membrane channel protein PorV [Flavobacteriales bacterium]HIO15924.1 type IX secretion system outer membrane channel protein PorV [Flavobacteriales bacterium]
MVLLHNMVVNLSFSNPNVLKHYMKNLSIINKFLAGVVVFTMSIGNYSAQLDPGEAASLVQLNTITTAVPFLMIAPDSRSGALGDAGVALSPDGNSLHWNPAKMAFSENELEVSLSYAPWLRALVDDMNLAYLTMVRKINRRQAYGLALRYFSLGNITFTDAVGTTIRDFQPAELSLDAGFSQRFTDRFSGGVAGRFVHSNLTGGVSVLGAESKPGISVAADVSMFYTNNQANWGGKNGTFNMGMNISNIGSKMSYTETAARDFIPANLRLGAAYTMELDDYNSLTFTLDGNKLLVPTAPVYDQQDGNTIVSGYSNDVGVATGIVQSFYDAPGIVDFNDDGTYSILSGSIFREELREVNFGGGFEYDFAEVFAFRAGYFYEHFSKGNRQFITMGAGMKYTVFTIDLSYLVSTTQQNPLANTLRFTLRMQFSDLSSASNNGG